MARIDPIVYVVRHFNGFSIYPFNEHVALSFDNGSLSGDEVLKAIRHLHVSLIVGENGGLVEWKAGADVTLDLLHQMEIC